MWIGFALGARGALEIDKTSGIRRFSALAQEMPVCFNLSVGEPDFCVPAHALDGGWRAVKEGRTHYAPTNGVPELRDALAQKANRDYGLNYDPNCEVLVTVGGTQAISTALMGLLNPGDEVLIPDLGLSYMNLVFCWREGFLFMSPCVKTTISGLL
jgi:aspartate/methionine/tyrosine aminotransferase